MRAGGSILGAARVATTSRARLCTAGRRRNRTTRFERVAAAQPSEAARGEARIVRFGSISNIAILAPGPGGAKALRAGGALLVFDPLILGGCLTGTRPIGVTA